MKKMTASRCLTAAIVMTIFVSTLTVLILRPSTTASSLSDDEIPRPWIIEPSTLDSEAPNKNGTLVVGGDFINVSAVELAYADDIGNTTFEYSPNGADWNIIGVTDVGIKEWENLTDIYGNPVDGFETWRLVWNTSEINEGLYYVRARMTDILGQVGQDQIQVYFDRTPPGPELDLSWGVTVNGTISISATTNATDIVQTQFESLKVSTWYDVPPVNGETGSGTNICVWNAMASLLKFWADQKNSRGEHPLENLTRDEQGNPLNTSQLIDALVAKYNKDLNATKTKTKNDGLSMKEVEACLRKWLRNRNSTWENWIDDKATPYYTPVARFAIQFEVLKELFQNGPVLAVVRIWNDTSKAYDIYHMMVVGSVCNTPFGDSIYYLVDFMDPSYPRRPLVLIMRNDGFMFSEYDKEDGKIVPKGKKMLLIDIIRLHPDNATLKDLGLMSYWVPEGIDYDGSDGWRLVLNTTKLEEGYHFIRATMVNSKGSKGAQTAEILVDNIPPIPGDHDIAITGLTASETVINVTVENQGRYTETAYISVYYDRIDPTIGVSLASGSNTTLAFEWTPPPGVYNITAESGPLLDEIDLSDNTLTTITSYVSGSQTSQSDSTNNWIVLAFCVLSVSFIAPEFSKKNKPKFEISATVLQQNLHTTETKNMKCDWVRQLPT